MRNIQKTALLAVIGLLLICLSAGADNFQPVEGKKINAPKITITQKADDFKMEASMPSQQAPERAVTQGPRAGGETFATATPIPALPYNDVGNTTGAADDYDPTLSGFCPSPTMAPDLVYSYTPTIGELISVTTCNSSYWTRLLVYENDESTLLACNQYSDSCLDPLHAAVFDISVTPPNTYYIVVDGFSSGGDPFGAYDMDVTAREPVDTLRLHPALADAGMGNLALGYTYREYDSLILWASSNDDGGSFTGGVYWEYFPGAPLHPDLAYWGEDTTFYGTFMQPEYEGGSGVFLFDSPNILDNATWVMSSWNFGGGDFDFKGMRDVDIATNNGREAWEWGFMSICADLVYQGTPYPVIDFIFYPTSADGYASMSAFGINGCSTSAAVIDPTTLKAYACYDNYDSDASQWGILIRQESSDDWDDALGWAGMWGFTSDPNNHLMFPSAEAINGRVLVAVEHWDAATPLDHNVLCFVSNGMTMEDDGNFVTVAGTTDDERYPQIKYVDAQTFVVVYHVGDSLYYSITEDLGTSWSLPELASLPDDEVVSEYLAFELAESDGNNVMLAYSYYEPSTEKYDRPTFIRIVDLEVISLPDIDGDGVADLDDNCINDYNPLQEDDDVDGVGNVCDNCPDVYNPGQEDANGNDIGDVCDWVCGDVTGEGNVDLLDILFLISYKYDDPVGPAPDPIESGDVNSDFDVNLIDILLLISYKYDDPPGDAPNCPTSWP